MRREPLLRLLALCCLLFLRSASAQEDAIGSFDVVINEQKCPVAKHGAVGDGKTNDRSAIQAAIDACAAFEEGGSVIFETGKTYLTGALRMPSKTTLRLPTGATLLASSEKKDYPPTQEEWYLILVEKATRVSIEGPGKIVGQSAKWVELQSGRKSLKSWPREGCHNYVCRPSLIGIRDSSQISIDNVELHDFVLTAIDIQRSQAVAVIGAKISADLSFTDARGIMVDASKRVFVGQTDIETGGNCIAAVASSAVLPLESLLVDNVVLRSSSAAFQVGPTAKAEVKTIVVQNARVEASHRGLAVQLQDSGDMHDIWFTNVTIAAEHMEGGGPGAAEGIHVSVKPGTAKQLGKMSNVWFGNVSCITEGGWVFSGDPSSTIDGITVKDSGLQLARRSSFSGTFRDFRPAKQGVVNLTSIPAIHLEYANHVALTGVKVVFGTPSRTEWGGLLDITPHTVHALQFGDVSMHDEAAHPSSQFVKPMKKLSQLGDFFKHSIREWANTISQKGFISLQENAAFGVSGRRAASSGSPAVMLLLVIVLIAICVRYCCVPALQSTRKRTGRLPS